MLRFAPPFRGRYIASTRGGVTENIARVGVSVLTTCAAIVAHEGSATVSTSIGVSASGQQTDQQHYGTATVGVVISSTASASVTSTHSGTATASIVITTTAAGETGATHAGTANIGVTISTSSSGTVVSPVEGTANIGVTISATAIGTASFIHSGTATVSVAVTTSANLVNTVDYLEDETPTPTVTFKADDLSLSNGDYVTNWSGYSRSGTGMGTYVSNAKNGYPSVAGNGYEASGGTGTYSENGDISCFVVMKGTSGFFLQNDNGQKGFQIGTSGVRSKSGSNYSWTTPFSAGFNTDGWGIYEVHAGNNGDPDMYSYKNVVDNLVNSSNTAYQTPNWTDVSSNNKGLLIPEGCEIAEFRFWTRELTTSERTALYEYLQTKYNLSGGIANVSVSISASADGGTEVTHNGTASCQVNLSASASGTHVLGDESIVEGLSGKLCWFDANDITGSSNGDALSSWPSRHDSGVSASNSTSSTQPIYNTNQVNSLPAVNFDADYLEVNYGSNTSQPLTAFIVCAYDVTSGGGSNNAIDGRDNPSGYRSVNFSMRTNGWGSYAGSSWMQPSSGSPDTDWHYFTVYLNGASSYVRKDGVSHATGNPGTQGTNGQILGMWKGKNTSYYMNGKIAEVLIFGGTLSDTNRNTTESYLKDKYNL